MDNKITKKRLADFLVYEWIAVVMAIVLFIAGWEVVFALVNVKPSVGQRFKYYYDMGISTANDKELYNFDNTDTSNYDCVIDTSSATVEEVAEKIYSEYQKFLKTR